MWCARAVLRTNERGVMMAAFRRVSCLAGGRAAPAARMLSSMTPAAKPQVLVTAFGPHKTGAVAKLSSIIFQNGGSIAQTKKVIVDEHFAMITAVFLPDDAQSTPAQLISALQSDATTRLLGFPVTARVLELQTSADDVSEDTGEQRRLKLELPQRPGLVLAVTELLKDHGCTLSSIDAETLARGDEIWFEIECLVDLPAGVDASRVESDLQYWVDQENQATLIFDRWLKPNVTTGLY